MRGLRAAASFLTRLPVGAVGDGSPDVGRTVAWFPVVGGLLGAGVASVYAASRLALPPIVAAALAIGCGVALTGAFHEDGLADTADGFGGGRSKEETLRIMRDPTHGTYGVLAVSLSLLLRVGALAALDGWTAVAILPAAHALARAACISLVAMVSPATGEGLGASYAASLGRREALSTVAVGLLIALVFLGGWILPAALIAGLATWIVGRLSVRKIGGITGDVLGAAEQATEVVVLLLGAAIAVKGLPSPAWWR